MALTLSSDTLSVSVLDPNSPSDDDKKGARYCTGGYIFQVSDSTRGELLTGPSGAVHEADNDFNVFSGQGLPEAFHANPTWLRGALKDPAKDDGIVLVIGVGLVDTNFKPPADPLANARGFGTRAGEGVVEFCKWEVTRVGKNTLVFETTQSLGPYKLKLHKAVSLTGRTVTSHTAITNLGGQLPLSWFPHPFFPYPLGKELCKTSTATRLVEPHKVLTQDDAGYVCWQDSVAAPFPGPDIGMGYIATTDTSPLTVLQNHPTVGMITTVCSFAPSPTVVGGEAYGEAIPIWGNEWAFSWEPFLNFDLATGEKRDWSIAYSFGFLLTCNLMQCVVPASPAIGTERYLKARVGVVAGEFWWLAQPLQSPSRVSRGKLVTSSKLAERISNEHYSLQLDPPITIPYLSKPRARLCAFSFLNSFTNTDTQSDNNTVKLAWNDPAPPHLGEATDQ